MSITQKFLSDVTVLMMMMMFIMPRGFWPKGLSKILLNHNIQCCHELLEAPTEYHWTYINFMPGFPSSLPTLVAIIAGTSEAIL